MLYHIVIYPIECIYKVLFLFLNEMFGSFFLALIGLSAVNYVILHPFTKWAVKVQAAEKHIQSILEPQLSFIKQKYHGAERHKEIQWLYTRYAYHPILSIRSVTAVILQLPFLMAAYFMLSDLAEIKGCGMGPISDLSRPDGLLYGWNLLPILMTVLNLLASSLSENFSAKDKLQSAVIAFLFLLLLYSAPSALLIYWTCNNLWTFLLALWDYGTTHWGWSCPAVRPVNQELRQWKKFFSEGSLVIPAFSLTLCFFVPMDIYVSNVSEIYFAAMDILPYLLIATAIIATIVFLILQILPSKGNPIAILFGLTFGIFLQSYLFPMQYGIFNGLDFPWEAYNTYGLINAFVWLLCVLIPLRLFHRLSPSKCRRGVHYGCIFLITVQSLVLCYVGASLPRDRLHPLMLTTRHMFQLSSRDNIIVLVLDGFDTTVFQSIQKTEPDLLAPLEGFTYYPDALSLYGYTDHSMPQMLTGKARQNLQPYGEYIREAWQDNAFYRSLKERNYDVGIYTDGYHYVSPDAPIDNMLYENLPINRYTLQGMASMTLFRCVPHNLKKYFVIYSGDLWKPEEDMDEQGIKPYSGRNVPFYHQFMKGVTLQNDTNSFRWYHIDGAHPPYQMSRDIEYLPNGERSTQYEQAVGALRIANAFLEKIKEAGIYDNATVLILADHGQHEAMGESFKKMRPLPLLLVKQPRSTGALRTSDTPVSYKDLLSEISKRFSENPGSTGFSIPRVRERTFYYIDARINIPIVVYHVEPHAERVASWHEAGTISYRVTSNDHTYHLGEMIDFRLKGNSELYKTSGWQQAEKGGAWIHGTEAELLLNIPQFDEDRDFLMKATVSPYLPNGLSHQQLGIYVNDVSVDSIELKHTQEISVTIPRDAIPKDGNIRIRFTVSDPRPEEGIEQNFVGVAFHSLSIDQPPHH